MFAIVGRPGRGRAVLASLFVLTVLLTACGGGEDETPTATILPSATNASDPLSIAMTLRGTVTRAGAPVTAGTVEALGPDGPCGTAQVDNEEEPGSFELVIYQERGGTYPGCRTGVALRFAFEGVEIPETRELRVRGNRRPLPLHIELP